MSTSDHETFRESLPAYALDALDSSEVPALEAHLRTCDECQADLAAYREIGTGLLMALPPKNPPASLRRKLRSQLERGTRPVTRAARWSWSQGLAAGALMLLIGLSAVSVLQARSLSQQQAEMEQHNRSTETLIAMLAYPGTQTVSFDQNGISGSALVDETRGLVGLFVWHLPAPEAGKTYQIWLIDTNGKRTSGGFLAPEEGYPFVSAVVHAPAPLAGFKGLGVTSEPSSGSPAPTGPRIFGVDF